MHGVVKKQQNDTGQDQEQTSKNVQKHMKAQGKEKGTNEQEGQQEDKTRHDKIKEEMQHKTSK